MQRYLTDQKLDSPIVENFIKHGRIGGRAPNSFPPGVILCDCHGDLHAKNILVRLHDRQPHLVDFSERSEKHWASDFAQLCANLLIRSWDYGVESHEWGNLKRWQQVLHQWLFSTDAGPVVDDRNNTIWACLVWIRDNFEDIWRAIHGDDVSLWQFQLALVVEFIKLAGQLDVCPPKRALALVATHDVLSQLENTIPVRNK